MHFTRALDGSSSSQSSSGTVPATSRKSTSLTLDITSSHDTCSHICERKSSAPTNRTRYVGSTHAYNRFGAGWILRFVESALVYALTVTLRNTLTPRACRLKLKPRERGVFRRGSQPAAGWEARYFNLLV